MIFARPGLGLGQLAGYPYVTWGLGGQVEVSISVGMSDSRGYHYHTSSGPGIHTGMLSAEDGIHRYLITVLIGMHEPAPTGAGVHYAAATAPDRHTEIEQSSVSHTRIGPGPGSHTGRQSGYRHGRIPKGPGTHS